MSKAVFPGSFDPITKGHFDIIKRASGLFDSVIIAVVDNPDKHNMFSMEQRFKFVKESCRDIDNVSVEAFDGLLIDFALEHDADVVLRGVRCARDFDYEYELAQIYYMTGKGLESIFLPSVGKYSHVSSSMVRELLRHGKDASEFLPFDKI